MSIYAAPVEVVNAALSRMGIRPIQGLDETSKPAIVANDIYEGVIRDLLTRHSWSFARKEATLVYQGTTTGEYSQVFVLPAEMLSLINIKIGETLIDYRVLEDKVLTNTADTSLRANYHYRAPEGKWADDFAEAVVRTLQAHFYRALREDEPAAERTEQAAEYKFMRAMVRDKRQSPPPKEQRINGGRLTSAWRGSIA